MLYSLVDFCQLSPDSLVCVITTQRSHQVHPFVWKGLSCGPYESFRGQVSHQRREGVAHNSPCCVASIMPIKAKTTEPARVRPCPMRANHPNQPLTSLAKDTIPMTMPASEQAQRAYITIPISSAPPIPARLLTTPATTMRRIQLTAIPSIATKFANLRFI